jgi:septum formation topological specificity factor MinE
LSYKTFVAITVLCGVKPLYMKVDRLLEHYCDMEPALRAELLKTVDEFLKQGRTVQYQTETYHHIEDLTVDIEAHCAQLTMRKAVEETVV